MQRTRVLDALRSMPMTTPSVSPLVLIVRDGWGTNPNKEHDAFNAVKLAKTPVADKLMREYPWTLIKTSGEDVGLPDGTMGNSEVGHQNIGAGRIVDQESVAITKACRSGLASGSSRNAVICDAITGAVARKGTLHLLGIASDAGVHGQLDHLFAIVLAAKQLGCQDVALHLFTDGRDTGPFTGKGYIEIVEKKLREIGCGRIASLCGRYYAMDRDNRWERVQLAYDVLTGRATGGKSFASAQNAIEDYYAHPTAPNMTGDEFVTPRVVGAPGSIKDGDAVIFYNYRGDRPREISAAFVFPDDKWAKVKPSPDSNVAGFNRGKKLAIDYIIMTEYWEELLAFTKVAFPKPPKMVNIGGAWLSQLGLTQFRCAETEKYPHVTFFFNDYRDEPFPGEKRENPQSPKVATYDMKPEMSALEIRDAVLRRLAASDCEHVLIVNFANGDMVGHTGKLDAAIKACETVDACVGAIVDATLKRGGALIVTADHGNAEQMFDPATNAPHTAHTTYDVPLIVVGEAFKACKLRGDTNAQGWFDENARAQRGCLGDIFPTLLAMMKLPKPAEMTGRSLIV
jgi:2,3-bisphosphoglycerate-independent phosphoglycerate mutase